MKRKLLQHLSPASRLPFARAERNGFASRTRRKHVRNMHIRLYNFQSISMYHRTRRADFAICQTIRRRFFICILFPRRRSLLARTRFPSVNVPGPRPCVDDEQLRSHNARSLAAARLVSVKRSCESSETMRADMSLIRNIVFARMLPE